MKKFFSFLVIPLLSLALGTAQADIISAGGFVSQPGYGGDALNGTMTGLSDNQPGATWVYGDGWNWSTPFVPQTLNGGVVNAVSLGEEKSVLSLALGSNGSYVKPTEFTYSADVYFYNRPSPNTLNLGFWSTQPTQSDGTDSLTNFTGLVLSANDGTLQLYSGGALQGAAISIGTIDSVDSTFYTLTYSVNTGTGAISNVLFDGSSVTGLASTTAFTDSATSFVGVASGSNSRGGFDALSVDGASAVPEPSAWALLLGGGIGLLVVVRRRGQGV